MGSKTGKKGRPAGRKPGKPGRPPKSQAGQSEQAQDRSQLAVIPVLNKGALSKDVGPFVVAGLAKAYDDEAKANEIMQGVDAKRYDLLAKTTLAIVKAAKADGSIDLSVAFASGDLKATNYLNDQIGIALGIREVVTVGMDEKAKQKIVYAKAVEQYFPRGGEDKDAPEVKRKGTFRSNFSHMLKKCTQAAAGIIDEKTEAKVDKKSGTLMLSGPAIKQQFGQPSVLLNERQVLGEGDDKVKLAEKPSFTAIAARAAEAHGKTIHRGTNTRGAGQSLTNPGAALESICKSFVAAVGKVKTPNATQIAAVKSVESAVHEWLDLNEKPE